MQSRPDYVAKRKRPETRRHATQYVAFILPENLPLSPFAKGEEKGASPFSEPSP